MLARRRREEEEREEGGAGVEGREGPPGEGIGRIGMEEGRETTPPLACLWTESDRDPRGRKCGQGEAPAVEINQEEAQGEMGRRLHTQAVKSMRDQPCLEDRRGWWLIV
jgi:hypothetical protein